MNKKESMKLAQYLSKKFLKKEFKDLSTPLEILMYGEISKIIIKAQHLKKIYGVRKLQKIWLRNREVGNNSKEWNDEVG